MIMLTSVIPADKIETKFHDVESVGEIRIQTSGTFSFLLNLWGCKILPED